MLRPGNRTMPEMVKCLYEDQDGLATVEYALLLSLLVVSTVGVWATFGSRLPEPIERTADAFGTSGDSASCGMMLSF